MLCKILTRIQIEGKVGRTVSILMTPSFKISIDLLLKWRDYVGVSEKNEYLFASCSSVAKYYYRGSACLQQFSRECKAKHPYMLISIRLCKHMATMAQVLNLKENELESLATFMGRNIKIHQDYYRILDNFQ